MLKELASSEDDDRYQRELEALITKGQLRCELESEEVGKFADSWDFGPDELLRLGLYLADRGISIIEKG